MHITSGFSALASILFLGKRTDFGETSDDPHNVPFVALGTALLDSPPAGTTALSTFFNLINNYVGMVLLSMHFTFARSGWLALPVLFGLTAFGAFTGDCIILCCQTLEV